MVAQYFKANPLGKGHQDAAFKIIRCQGEDGKATFKSVNHLVHPEMDKTRRVFST